MECEIDPTALLYDILTAELEAALPGSTSPLPAANADILTISPSTCSQTPLQAGEAREEGTRKKAMYKGGQKRGYFVKKMRQRKKQQKEARKKIREGKKDESLCEEKVEQNIKEEETEESLRVVESPREDSTALQRQQQNEGGRSIHAAHDHERALEGAGRRKYRERTPLSTYDERPVGNPAHRSRSPHNLHPLYRQRTRSPSSSFGQQPSRHRADVLEYDPFIPYHSNISGFRQAAAAAESKPQTAPETVYDLARFSRYVCQVSANNSRHSSGNENLGKVNASHFGSTPDKDLGLCYATFVTQAACPSGASCPWRHHPLSEEEKAWIRGNGCAMFLDIVGESWGTPSVPVPGANLLNVVDPGDRLG